MKYIDAEKLKAEIERRIKSVESCPFIEAEFGAEMKREGKVQAYNEILSFINSLQQEQPKFNVGDLVVSKKNPHLTYKILATNIPNELGKTDYKVEIFTDGKPGILDEPHNIHLISSDRIEDWGELVQQEQSEVSLEREIRDYFSKWNYNFYNSVITMDNDIVATLSSIQNVARHFYELGLNARKEE